MHLVDNQLLELNHNSFDQTSAEHLKQCDICQQRMRNRAAFQEKLSQSHNQVDFDDNWNLLQEDFNNSQGIKHRGLQKKIKSLQVGLFAVAACLCLVIIIPMLSDSQPHDSIDDNLATLIEENHQLQRSIELVGPYGSYHNVAIENLKIRLQQVDSEIQLSYLERLPKTEKLKLWQLRKRLLLQSIEKLNGPNDDYSKTI